MKHLSKRLLVLLLAAASLSALSVPAWAAGTSYYLYKKGVCTDESTLETSFTKEVTLKISCSDTSSTAEVKAWWLMGLACTEDDYGNQTLLSPDTYLLTTPGARVFGYDSYNTLGLNYFTGTTGSLDNTNTVTTALNSLTTVSAKRELASNIASLVTNTLICNSSTETRDYTVSTNLGGGSASLAVYPGYYLITCDGTAPMLLELGSDKINQTVNVSLKAAYPTMNSSVDSSNDAITAIGDTVQFTLTSTLPDLTAYTETGAQNFVFNFVDTLPAGLTYDGSLAMSWKNPSDSQSTTISGGSSDSNVSTETDSTTGETTVTMSLGTKLLEAFNATSGNKPTAGATVQVTFDARVNTSAVNGGTGNVNSAHVQYSCGADTTETDSSAADVTTVYTFDLPVKTVAADADGNASTTPLAGAVYRLYKQDSNGNKKYYALTKNSEGTKTTAITWSATESDAETFTSGADGMVTIHGLGAAADYYLEQVTAPSASGKTYNKLENPVPVTISATMADGSTLGSYSVTLTDSSTTSGATSETGSNMITVINTEKIALPATGARGAAVIIALGVAAVIGGVVVFDRKRGRG